MRLLRTCKRSQASTAGHPVCTMNARSSKWKISCIQRNAKWPLIFTIIATQQISSAQNDHAHSQWGNYKIWILDLIMGWTTNLTQIWTRDCKINNYRTVIEHFILQITDESTAVQPMFYLHNMWIVFCYMYSHRLAQLHHAKWAS